MAGSPLELGLSTASSASTGDKLSSDQFHVDFGDKIAGAGSGQSSPISGLVSDITKGVAVALLAKFAWENMGKIFK